jgi:hypothetical protein
MLLLLLVFARLMAFFVSGLVLLMMLLALVLSASAGACRRGGIASTSSGFCPLLCLSTSGGNGASGILHSGKGLAFFAPLEVAFLSLFASFVAVVVY